MVLANRTDVYQCPDRTEFPVEWPDEAAQRGWRWDQMHCPLPLTPLSAVAGAVVTDAGGILSHCAVVARESGIPAVVGCRSATRRMPDGALITVDGTRGVVTLDA